MTFNQYKVNYKGLHKRPTYEGLINYLQNEQETIQYPNRAAKHARTHPYLTQLDGDDYEHMNEQQLSILRAKMNEDKLNEQAGGPGGPGTNVLRVQHTRPTYAASDPGNLGSVGIGNQYNRQRSSASDPGATTRPGILSQMSTPRSNIVHRPAVFSMSRSPSDESIFPNYDIFNSMQRQESEHVETQQQVEEDNRLKLKNIALQGLLSMSKEDIVTNLMEQRQKSEELKKQKELNELKKNTLFKLARNKDDVTHHLLKIRESDTPSIAEAKVPLFYPDINPPPVKTTNVIKYWVGKMKNNRSTIEANLEAQDFLPTEYESLTNEKAIELWLSKFSKKSILKYKESVGFISKSGAASSSK